MRAKGGLTKKVSGEEGLKLKDVEACIIVGVYGCSSG